MTTTTEIFKCYKNSTLSDAQNAGNHISKLLDFNFFFGGGGGWGGMPPDPLEEWSLAAHSVVTAACYTFSGLKLKLLKPLWAMIKCSKICKWEDYMYMYKVTKSKYMYYITNRK